jgi:hypothetical protein
MNELHFGDVLGIDGRALLVMVVANGSSRAGLVRWTDVVVLLSDQIVWWPTSEIKRIDSEDIQRFQLVRGAEE